MAASNARSRASGIVELAQSLLNRVVSEEKQQQWYKTSSDFANEQPLLFALILIQILLCFTPLLIFAIFIASTVLFSLSIAVIFSLFWLGVALLVLVPTILIAFSFGLGLWIWGASSFIFARWVYSLIPVNVKGGVQVEMPSGKVGVVKKTGEGYGDVEAKYVDISLPSVGEKDA